MPAIKKQKKLTNAQKNMNRVVKKDLQERGILPPDKKPLNRKKFACEVLDAANNDSFNFYDHLPYLVKAFSFMLPYKAEGKIISPVTSEQIGILKAIKISMEIKDFWERKRAEGYTEATIGELYEKAVKPVIDL